MPSPLLASQLLSPLPCVDEDAGRCEREVGSISDKITKCKTSQFIAACPLTCGYCLSPPPPPPTPSGSPPPETSLSPLPCVDEDTGLCEREVGRISDKIIKCKTPQFIAACPLTCGYCLSPPPSPPPGSPPPSPPTPPLPCVDEDTGLCEREVGRISDKITKCKTPQFIAACPLSCGHCLSPPPSPPPGSPPPSPSLSPLPCVDEDTGLCE
eukprot:scaffold22584_cov35-Phaeocystis_antarctica.AAC.1